MFFDQKRIDKELFKAVKEGDTAKLERLLKEGADVNVKDDYGRTPLHVAAEKGEVEIVKLLLEKGADVNVKNNNGQTPLHYAASGGYTEIVKLLLERGADVNVKNKNVSTPLHDAAFGGYTEIVKLLLERGADPEIKDGLGLTARGYAELPGSEHIARIIEEFMKKPIMILGIEYSELTAGKWNRIHVKIRGRGMISLKLEGDLDFVAPEPASISGVSSIEVLIRPRSSGELPVKVIAESSETKESKIFLLNVKGDTAGMKTAEMPAEKTAAKLFQGFPAELLSKYEPLEFIGEGGFARVFKVKNRSSGEIVALKMPKLDEKAGKAFLNEVSTWMRLNHGNIVRLIDANVVPFPYLELEFVEGAEMDGKLFRSLEELPKPLDERRALKIVKGIASALSYAHTRGVLHRDLKPGNILLTRDFEPKITDWGLAKIQAVSSMLSGFSPLYAAPEQLSKAYGSVDQRTDIFQLGVIFYELLTGSNPFEGYSFEEVAGKIIDESFEIPKPSSFSKSLGKFDGIIAKMLSRRREGRFGSADELIAELTKLEEEDIEKRIEELKKSLSQSIESLKSSMTSDEIIQSRRRVVEYLCELCTIYAELDRKPELLNCLGDLKLYCRESLNEIVNAAKSVELMIKERIPVSEDFCDRLKVVLHAAKRENEV